MSSEAMIVLHLNLYNIVDLGYVMLSVDGIVIFIPFHMHNLCTT